MVATQKASSEMECGQSSLLKLIIERRENSHICYDYNISIFIQNFTICSFQPVWSAKFEFGIFVINSFEVSSMQTLLLKGRQNSCQDSEGEALHLFAE